MTSMKKSLDELLDEADITEKAAWARTPERIAATVQRTAPQFIGQDTKSSAQFALKNSMNVGGFAPAAKQVMQHVTSPNTAKFGLDAAVTSRGAHQAGTVDNTPGQGSFGGAGPKPGKKSLNALRTGQKGSGYADMTKDPNTSEVEEGLEETQMKINHEQVDLAMAEIGSAVLRLHRAGLTETQARLVVKRLTELDELPVSCDEKMWNHGGPKGDDSAEAAKRTELKGGAVKEGPDDAPDTERDNGEDAPETTRDPVQSEGWDRFMDQILMSEGRKETKINAADSPGMLHAKRYGEKAHNRIVWKR